jgi:hypothetical protein
MALFVPQPNDFTAQVPPPGYIPNPILKSTECLNFFNGTVTSKYSMVSNPILNDIQNHIDEFFNVVCLPELYMDDASDYEDGDLEMSDANCVPEIKGILTDHYNRIPSHRSIFQCGGNGLIYRPGTHYVPNICITYTCHNHHNLQIPTKNQPTKNHLYNSAHNYTKNPILYLAHELGRWVVRSMCTIRSETPIRDILGHVLPVCDIQQLRIFHQKRNYPVIRINEKFGIYTLPHGNEAAYIGIVQHQEEANCRIKKIHVSGKSLPSYLLISSRMIQPDEQLTVHCNDTNLMKL